MTSKSTSPLYPLASDGFDLFPELAISLFYWVDRLYQTIMEQGIEQVFFLSREGQPLMRMFEAYRERKSGRITSRYLEVSRRSTLLPSLAPLGDENFETLFRQYRQVSLFEFLSSLGLEAQTGDIASALDLSHGAEFLREENFPTSSTFLALKVLPRFVELYESERLARREAFIAYLAALSGGTLPARLVVVDVGWKGTIQDNLFNLLCRDGNTPVDTISGYYIGLLAEGAADPKNDKHGLLFSRAGGRSPRFHVFNENRSLFEVVLAADHGSIVSYEFDATGHGKPVRDAFEEEEMLKKEVFPLQRYLFANFQSLVDVMSANGQGHAMPFDQVVGAHARIVFRPTARERAWFASVFHVENYGVFERSYFSTPQRRFGLLDRMKFLAVFLRRRGFGVLGFWPWNTLYERGGTLPAALYAAIRRHQR